jgi:hypothetical protein
MIYKIVHHGGSAVSLVRELERQGEGKGARHKGVIRDRVLLQMADGKAVVLKGSIMLSGVEIARALQGAAVE